MRRATPSKRATAAAEGGDSSKRKSPPYVGTPKRLSMNAPPFLHTKLRVRHSEGHSFEGGPNGDRFRGGLQGRARKGGYRAGPAGPAGGVELLVLLLVLGSEVFG